LCRGATAEMRNPHRRVSASWFYLSRFAASHERGSSVRVPLGGGEVAGIDNQRCAGDARGILATQKQDGLGDIVWRERDAHRNATQPRGEGCARIGVSVQVFAPQ